MDPQKGRRSRKNAREDSTEAASSKAPRVRSSSQQAADERRKQEYRQAEEELKASAALRRRQRLERLVDEEEEGHGEQAANDDGDSGWEDVSSDDGDGYIEPYGPDDEEIIDDDEDNAGNDDEAENEAGAEMLTDKIKSVAIGELAEGADESDDEKKVWRPDVDQEQQLAQGQKLDYSNKAYDCFFQMQSEYPSLSFGIVQDKDGVARTKYPLGLFVVCGSQAERAKDNQLYVVRVTNLCRTKHDAESDDSEDSFIGDDEHSDNEGGAAEDGDEVNNGEPMVDFKTIKHAGTTNRIRLSHHRPMLAAVWSELGHVQIFDIANEMSALEDPAAWAKGNAQSWKKGNQKSSAVKFTSHSHSTEGYALDWSRVAELAFATGDCAGDLLMWKPTPDGSWVSAGSAKAGMRQCCAVEEIKWSPVQPDVLVCGRMGGTVEVWDTRDTRKSQIAWQADPSDINVLDWNTVKQASHLMVTGAESGQVAVWDLRRVGRAAGVEVQPLQCLSWHRKAITSVEFSAHNESVLLVSSDDGQCTLWDLSLERDPSEEKEVMGELFGRQDLMHLPDQLMFLHQGLQHCKEAHWHPQIPGMVLTTDFNGMHIFKPMNWRSLMK